jgi:hypothetical protein
VDIPGTIEVGERVDIVEDDSGPAESGPERADTKHSGVDGGRDIGAQIRIDHGAEGVLATVSCRGENDGRARIVKGPQESGNLTRGDCGQITGQKQDGVASAPQIAESRLDPSRRAHVAPPIGNNLTRELSVDVPLVGNDHRIIDTRVGHL